MTDAGDRPDDGPGDRDPDTTLLPASRGERRRRLEAERLHAEAADPEPKTPEPTPELTPEPTREPDPGPGVPGPAHSAGDPQTTSSIPVIRPPLRPPTPEEAPPPPVEERRHRAPSWDDTVTGRIPVVRERVNRERPATPRHSASTASAVVEPPAPRDTTLTVLLAVVLLAALGLGVGLYLVLRGGATPAANPTVTPGDGDRTLLVVLDDGADTLVSASILGVDDGTAVSVLVPGGLQVDGLATGRTLLAQSLTGGGASPADALSGLLRLRIDATLWLSPSTLATLVDAEGGVVVDVDKEALSGDILVPAGDGQRLNGEQASVFAAFLDDGEPEQARLARSGAVLSAVVRGLPGTQDEVTALVRSLQPAPAGPDLVASLLWSVREAAGGEGISATVLPVTAGTAGSASAFTLDATKAAALLEANLPGALLPEPEGGVVRVLVRNGAGTAGLSDAARQRLQAVGLRFVGGGNADRFDYTTSRVLVASGSADDAARGRRVAAALGLPADSVAVAELGTSLADVEVVLGEDFAKDVTDRGVLPSASSTP